MSVLPEFNRAVWAELEMRECGAKLTHPLTQDDNPTRGPKQ
jgi:hypothetical protein